MQSRRDVLRAGAVAVGAGLLAPSAMAREGVAREGVAREGVARRDGYLLSEGVIYLNHASIGTVHRDVLDARDRLAREIESDPWRYTWTDVWEDRIAAARAATAQFMGTEPHRLAMLRSTTEAMSIAALGLGLGPGDEVLFSSLNHTGASACFELGAKRLGYMTRRFEFPVRDTPGLTPRDVVRIYAEQIRDTTRVLVFPHVDNIVGMRYPAKELANEARRLGVEFVIVDGAQMAGMMPLSVGDLGVDLYATSAHKWVQAPKVTGIAVFGDKLLAEMDPLIVTWGRDLWSDARRFEDYGTHDAAAWPVFREAVLRAEQNPGRALEWRMMLRRRIEDHCDAAGFTYRSPRHAELQTPIAAVEVDGIPSREVFARMNRDHGYVFRAFSERQLNTCRISVNTINTRSEADGFFAHARG